MRLPKAKGAGVSPIDLTPLVDVIFLLLVFFILTSSYMIQPGVKITLPKVGKAENVQRRRVEIIIDEYGRYYMQGQQSMEGLSLARLDAILKEVAHDGLPVLIKADANVRLKSVFEVYDRCSQAGISAENLSIATQAKYE